MLKCKSQKWVIAKGTSVQGWLNIQDQSVQLPKFSFAVKANTETQEKQGKETRQFFQKIWINYVMSSRYPLVPIHYSLFY